MSARANELAGGTQHGGPVDPVVIGEMPVFIGNQHVEEAPVDLRHGDRQPPAAVGGGERAQQRPVRIDHLDRDRQGGEAGRLRQARREAGDEHAAAEDAARHEPEEQEDGGDGPSRPPRPAPARAHGPTGATSMLPAAVLARSSGRYMSSIVAPGSTNRPGEVARTR